MLFDINKLTDPKIREKIWDEVITPLNEETRKKALNSMKEAGFKRPSPEFNDGYLRFDDEYLAKVRGSVCLLPLEFMAEYVDGICKESIDEDDGVVETQVLATNFNEDIFNQINSTALGNTAYIFLHTKNEKIKEKCINFLKRYLNWHLDAIIKFMSNNFQNLSVN